jgi:hypothetical protein
MILVRSSSGSNSIKHTVGIKEKGGIAQRRGLEFERRRGLKLGVTRVEVDNEG